MRNRLIKLVQEAVKKAQADGALPPAAVNEISIERPQHPEHGDYASNLPLKLAKLMGKPPMQIAREIAAAMPPAAELEKVAVAPPGFINFTVKNSWLARQVEQINRAGALYGSSQNGKGQKVQVEFVSINPTGPLHAGHGRGAILGSTLANALAASGYSVEKEYYFNDAGKQMEAFKQSLYARYLQQFGQSKELPENGYHGVYMVDMAKEIVAAYGDRFVKLPEAEGIVAIGAIGLKRVIELIKTELAQLGIVYDVWFSEQSLYKDGQYKTALAILEKSGHLTQKDSATWFVSSALGEDKDNVVVRSDGMPTYFAADIAYHYNKFVERGFDKVIDIWGADHHGHVSRLKTVVGALGIDPARLQIIIHQMVMLKRGGELVRISKRTGDIVTLKEVMDEVGVDACRFFFLVHSANSQMEFDLELAKTQSQDNPVYYIQYAHARICSILRLAKEKGIDFANGDVMRLDTAPELTLIRKLIQFPEIIEMIAATLEPHHLAYYAQELATVFNQFYKDCRVVTDDTALTQARLKLVQATQTVLSRALRLMGMTAPETM